MSLKIVPFASASTSAEIKPSEFYSMQTARLAARLLHPKTHLATTSRKYNLLEIEFYIYDSIHLADEYSHKHPFMLSPSQLYFHTQGRQSFAFRGGTRKGLDITCGAGPANNVFAGFLIRAMQDTSTGDVIEGPSLCVDRILTDFSVGSLCELFSQVLNYETTISDTTAISLSISDENLATIASTRRIGLTPGKYPQFWDMPARYINPTTHNLLRKKKRLAITHVTL